MSTEAASTPEMTMYAFIEGNYRYVLGRKWAKGRVLVIIMLNPSSANALKDDPTLKRCIHFAKMWGFGGLIVVNPFAWRAAKPSEVFDGSVSDPVGPRCDEFIGKALQDGDMYLCAWGNPPSKCPAINKRMKDVETLVLNTGKVRNIPVVCLGTTMHGFPKHPLARGVHRVPNDQPPLVFNGKGKTMSLEEIVKLGERR